ncbi:tripartite tricarboxylate transporter TctB family protein [Amorphus sp. MBR-141]
MQTDAPQTNARDIGGMAAAAVFIVVGAIALYDTTTYADIDSAVFPRAVSIGLVLSSLGYLIYALLPGPRTLREKGGSTPRRVALVAVMLLSVIAMPWIGFLASGIIAFLCLIVVAMHDPWTPRNMLLYPVIGIVIVGGFFALFRYGLQVPLPEARLF